MRGKRLTKSASIAVALVLIASLAAFATSCGMKGEASEQIGVVVTILPQAEFVEKVGGDKVNVTVMVPPGAEPHTYEPTPSQMTAVSRAKMYAEVGSGIGFELAWMGKLIEQNKGILVVDCSKGIALQEMTAPDEDVEPGGMDPHIWMSPVNAETMVQNICDGLVQIDPANKAYYEENRDAYLQELTQLDQDIRNGLSGVVNRRFIVDHPAFGYFAKEYNLTMISIEVEGKEPTPAGITHLIDQAKEYNIKVIFVSPQFNQQSAEVIASAIGGEVVSIDPLAKDYITNMRLILDRLVQANNADNKNEVSGLPLWTWIFVAIGVVMILIIGGLMILRNLVHG
jgi:zinc transport system substrate-binding protein